MSTALAAAASATSTSTTQPPAPIATAVAVAAAAAAVATTPTKTATMLLEPMPQFVEQSYTGNNETSASQQQHHHLEEDEEELRSEQQALNVYTDSENNSEFQSDYLDPNEFPLPGESRRRKKLLPKTITHVLPRPPGGYKYSMGFLYGIGNHMAGVTLDIPTPTSITPRTLRTSPPPPLPPVLPLMPRSGNASPSTAFGAATVAAAAAAAAAAPAASAAINANLSTQPQQFLCPGYTGPQRHLWHAENAVWQFDRSYPYNQVFGSQYGIPMMPLGFDHHSHGAQRFMFPNYNYNNPTAAMSRGGNYRRGTSNQVTAAEQQQTQQQSANAEQVVAPQDGYTNIGHNYGQADRFNRQRERFGPGRHAHNPMSFARESKTFYNSNSNGTSGAPGTRIRHPFDPRTGLQPVSNNNMSRRGGHQNNNPNNNHNGFQSGRQPKSSRSQQLLAARSSHSSYSVSPSSSKTKFEQRAETSSGVSLPTTDNHQPRSYRNRARYMNLNAQQRGQQLASFDNRMPRFANPIQQAHSYNFTQLDNAVGYSLHYVEAGQLAALQEQDVQGISATSSGTSDGEYAGNPINAELLSDADAQSNSLPNRGGDCDTQSFESFPTSSSDSTESEQSDASLKSMVRKITMSCLALATSAQMPKLKGPNLIPFGDMRHLRESECMGPQRIRNGFKCSSHCCGDMLVEPKSQPLHSSDGVDNNSLESLALSCSPSAHSSNTVLANSNQVHIDKDEASVEDQPLTMQNRYWHEFFGYTPADRFLTRCKHVEMKRPPCSESIRHKWDSLTLNIWQKFREAQQTRTIFKTKMRLWRFIYKVTMAVYPRYGVYLVGSSISFFGCKCSDMDICMLACTNANMDTRTEAIYHLQLMREMLNATEQFQDFNLIEARVPILRFMDRRHNVEVDINFNNSVGIRNTHLLYCYSQLEWRLRPIALTIKQWAQHHNINNAKNMTISSYSLMLMVIHFLQAGVNPPVLPCLHKMYPEKFCILQPNDFGYVDMNEIMPPYKSENRQSLGELLLGFLQYYSIFDYGKFAISIRIGGMLPVESCRAAKAVKNDVHQWNQLCIEEPFDLTNTARSVYDAEIFKRIRAIFLTSYNLLESTHNLISIFDGYEGPVIKHPDDSDNDSVHKLRGNASSMSNSVQTSPRQMMEMTSAALWNDIRRNVEPTVMEEPVQLHGDKDAKQNANASK
ncbi:poly(A) RNA polymerase gld-2 homolog A isoform X2 [Drosophila grimshawi]|uniref:poly(A) RNA polymerase gld-2 homolog A isoform X2 n=1 Tax=Drosophila grimshawi TaxID=7222 RepID=UPI000C870CBE|nr:poly(A) RNA polymerase gld-2 homolog A isoform X2 [Drosophila grimshawi]